MRNFSQFSTGGGQRALFSMSCTYRYVPLWLEFDIPGIVYCCWAYNTGREKYDYRIHMYTMYYLLAISFSLGTDGMLLALCDHGFERSG